MIYFNFKSPLLCIAGLILSIGFAYADTVISTEGEVLKGTILEETEDRLTIQSELVGTVVLDQKNIAKIVKDAPEKLDSITFSRRLENLNAPIENDEDQSYDWIRLDSGEWLKGSIDAMYSNTLEFDSDKLNGLQFDWEDIVRLQSAENLSIRINKDTTRTGRVAMIERQLSINDSAETAIGQFDLISIVPDSNAELDTWTANLSFSASYRTGYTEQRDMGLSATLQKRTSKVRFNLDFLANYSVLNNVTSSRDLRVNSYFDSFRSKRVFFRLASLEYFRDPLQNIEHRITLGSSIGYHIIENRKTSWDVTFGPALQRVEYFEVVAGESKVEDDPALLLTTDFSTEITSTIDLEGSYKIQYANTGGGLTIHTLTKLEFELSDNIDFELSFLWDRIDNPVATGDGTTLGQDDFRTTIGIGIDL